MRDNSNAGASLDGFVRGVPGAVIREVAMLPAHLPGAAPIGPYTEAAEGALLFAIPGVARFLVRDGTAIDIAVAAGGDRAAARAFLESAALGVLIHQRGELSLNAATLIAPTGIGVAICGSSGAGKSSLAMTLCQRGWLLVADEITRVTVDGSAAVAWPSDTRVKLWRDACEAAELNPLHLEPVRRGMERYYVLVPASPVPNVLGIAVRLRIAPAVHLTELPASQRAMLLSESTFRPRLVDAQKQREAYDRIVSQVALTCRTLILDGARERPVIELADCLEDAVQRQI